MTRSTFGFRIGVALVLGGWLSISVMGLPKASAGDTRGTVQPTPGFWNAGFGVARGCSWYVNATAVDSQGRLYVGLSGIGQTCGDASGAFFRYNPGDQSFTSLGTFSQAGGETLGASVSTLSYHDQVVYVGGGFHQVDGVEVNGVARFDTVSETWSGLGAGLARDDGQAFARTLLVTDDEIWVGGAFTQAGDVETTGVARFERDSGEWEALGEGLNNAAWSLALAADGTLYVGGQFTEAGGEPAQGLAAWDGNNWNAVPDFTNTAAVRALAYLDGRLYVGGSFTMTIDGTPYRGVVSWDSTEWSGLGSTSLSGNPLATVQVTSLAVHQGNVYVGGSFKRADGVDVRNLARWDPTSQAWSSLGTGDAIGLRRGAIARLLREGANTITVHESGLYVGGLFTQAGDQPVNNVARFDLTTDTWSALGSDSGRGLNAQDIFHLTVHAGEVLTSGIPAQGGLTRLHGTGRWNPVTESWLPFGSPQGPVFYGVTRQMAAAGGSVFASTGTSINILDNIDAIDINPSNLTQTGGLVRWDQADQAWIAVNNEGRDLTVISVVGGSGDRLYAGGSFSEAGETRHALRVWDTSASTWTAVGGNLDALVRTIALGSDGSVYAGGDFENADAAAARGVARWDPITTEWSALNQGLSNSDGTPAEVIAVAIGPTGDVYAGGQFDTAGSAPANNIARWDGSQWHALGDGIASTEPDTAPAIVAALVVAESGEVFAGGRFDLAGGQAAKHLARWDGAAWSVVGDSAEANGVDLFGTTGVRAMALMGADLFVGGRFGRAGGLASAHFAKFTRDLGGASVEIDIDVEELSEPSGPDSLAVMTRSFATGLRYIVDVRNPRQNMARNVDFQITANPIPDQVEWTCRPLIGNAVCPATSGTGLPDLVFNLPGMSTLRFEILVSVPAGNSVYEQTLNANSTLEPVFSGDVLQSQTSSSTLVNDRIFSTRFD